jgi:hypothetical protein
MGIRATDREIVVAAEAAFARFFERHVRLQTRSESLQLQAAADWFLSGL